MIAKLFGWTGTAWTKIKADVNSALMINESGGPFAPIRVYNGGSALTTDADPNTAVLAPGDARVIQWPTAYWTASSFGFVAALGGTSIVGRFWIYEAANAKWLPIGNLITLTIGATQGATATLNSTVKPFYFQITTVTGVTELYYGLL